MQEQPRYRLALSVVSHGQAALVGALLKDLERHVDATVQVIVTLNLPEDESFLRGLSFPCLALRNDEPLGFGANHNRAFARSEAAYFVVLNPDIRLNGFDFERLLKVFDDSRVGAVAPVVRGPSGKVEDSARRFPSLPRILRRVLRRAGGGVNEPDYLLQVRLTPVDWVAGMFVIFESRLFARLGGFDERYFMYLEDADICRRIGLLGRQVVVCNDLSVIHDARRATLRSGRHFKWHATSMLRFFADTLRLRLSAALGRAPRLGVK